MHPFRKTKTHPIEVFAEQSIRVVASATILLIFLILVFVFKEATVLFFPGTNTEQTASTDVPQTSTSDSPEAYGTAAASDQPNTESRVDSYVADSSRSLHQLYVPRNADYPEIYNAETGNLPTDVAASEASTSEASGSNAAKKSLMSNLSTTTWQPVSENPKFGLWPLFIGTVKTTAVAIAIGAPLGILAAIYSAFFAPRKLRQILKPAIELLAGFPSVVLGFFCLVTIASFLQNTFGLEYRLNALVGGIGMALAVIPIVFAISEDALSAVPKTLREASLALGSSEWQTAYRVMLPAAAPGVFAAIILGIGRAFGETMIALMATGNAALADWNPLSPGRTFAATIGSEMGEVVWGSEHYGVLFLIGALLFVVSFSLNAFTELYVKQRLIKKFQGQ
ncbi:MAG: phosphate ABC transporter permease subunit PstC [Bradyrhizobiaceae bacterium]|nr:phosphate ABC transporter permease subunit PstC [Bradyrhizobiaceae bacterium]